VTLLPQDRTSQDLANARERVSFLVWALETHRAADRTRGAYWRKIEADYIAKLDDARRELERMETPSG
jgi:hypothetical protein